MTTWVLLRGLAREAGHWGDFPRQLASVLGPQHQVIAPDLPGNGMRWRERSPASVAQLAQALREDVAARREPVHVVALSLGGMVALEWARTAPQELRSCVLVNTSLRALNPFWQRLRPASYPTIAAAAMPWTSVAQREAAVLAMTSSTPERHRALLRRWAQIAAERPVSAANLARQLLAAARYRAPAQRPRVPMIVMCSAGDRLVSPACSHGLARHWALPLAEHPSAGHDLPLDAPEWLAARLRDTVLLSKP